MESKKEIQGRETSELTEVFLSTSIVRDASVFFSFRNLPDKAEYAMFSCQTRRQSTCASQRENNHC